jgi:predicted metal-dependent peptidase
MHKTAYDRLVKARMILLMDHPFFGVPIMQLRLVECWAIPTMATDGRHIFYNPLFVMSTLDVHLIGDMAHEALHCLYRHHLRMGSRELKRWNIACDYVINYDLRRAGFKLQDWVLYDVQYAGCSSEEVYNLMPKDPPTPNPQQGQEQGRGNGSGNGKGQGKGKEQGQQPGQQPPQGGSGGSGPAMPSYAPDPGQQGGVVPASVVWDQATIEQETQRWETIAKQAAAIAKAHNAGSMPGFLEGLLKDLDKPRVSWQQVLTNFVDTVSNDEFTFNRPNRRFISKGMKLPTLHSDKLRRILAVVDTSGSTLGEPLKRYASEVSSFLDLGLADYITVIYADTKVHRIEDFERGDEIVLDPKGGGGTNFRDVMNKVKEYDDASVILFFTDLFTLDFGDEPDCPLMWVCYGDPREYAQYKINIPFGETIFIPPN